MSNSYLKITVWFRNSYYISSYNLYENGYFYTEHKIPINYKINKFIVLFMLNKLRISKVKKIPSDISTIRRKNSETN